MLKMPKYIIITIFAVLLVLLVLPQTVSAALVPCGRECTKWENDVVGSKCITAGTEPDGTPIPLNEAQPCNLCHVFKLMQNITNGVGLLALGWAALFIVIGGIIILTSAGSPDKASTGKRMITYSIIGVIIVFGAWIIINTVMNALVNQEKMPWAWNKIQCVPTEPVVPPPPPPPVGEYCVCEIPVYATATRDMQLFTEIQGTNLNTAENCSSNCISSNASTYCPNRVTSNNPKLYCANQSALQAKAAFCYKQEATTDSITGACFANWTACSNSTFSNPNYEKKCWFDDELHCDCTTGLATWCTSSNPIGLYQTTHEVGVGGLFNAWDCIRNCGYSGGYCRLTEAGGNGNGNSTITVGTCAGVNCSDANLNICGSTSNNCSTGRVNSWNTQIWAAASDRTICAGVNTVRMVKAIMARESGGVISRIAADGRSAGLMQLTPETANSFKNACGVSENIDFNWLTNSANAEKQICIAIEFLKSLVGACGCDIGQLAAGYNGGGGKTGACDQSTNCGPAASADGGECLICSGESFTRRWECLWDDNKHTICNADRATGSFEATRRYVPQVAFCYNQF